MSDDTAPRSTGSSVAQSLEAAAARLRPRLRLDSQLYRVVEVVRAPNGRIARMGQVWHSDLDQARRFGHALAANAVDGEVQVSDANGRLLERIEPPAAGAAAPGWGDWKALPVPPPPLRPPPQPVRRIAAAPVAMPAVEPPPTVVPPLLPPVPAVPAVPPAPTAEATPARTILPQTRPPVLDLPPESEVERTNPLPPTQR